jgi:hypothetical protein
LGGRERKRGFGAALWGAARFRSARCPLAARASAGPPLPVLAPFRAEPLAGAHRHPARRVHREILPRGDIKILLALALAGEFRRSKRAVVW